MQFTILSYANSQYPKLLREIHNPPARLYLQGNLLERPLIAIVGSRRYSEYGRQVTYKLASELAAAGLGIISGLAIGIDAVAHQAALDAGGYTIAVLGSGLNMVYPARNRGLAQKVLDSGGALLTEQEPDMPPLRHHFPARNRIIAGLSQGVLVTEAARASGSLITAQFAREENREVLAVPGDITHLSAFGPNSLIKTGATPVTTAADVLTALGLSSSVTLAPPAQPANAAEAQILALLDEGITASAELIRRSGMSAAQFAQTISLMEITGKVRNLGASTWIRS
jgi:DNA processing protein